MVCGRVGEKGERGMMGRIGGETNLQYFLLMQVCHPDDAFAEAVPAISRTGRAGMVPHYLEKMEKTNRWESRQMD